MSHRVDVDQATKTIRFVPTGAHTASMLVLHGLGDTAMGWADPVQMWMGSLPNVKFVLPTAPTRPVSLNMGHAMPSWYDIKGLGERSDETCDGIEASRATVEQLVAAEVQEGIAHRRIVVGGFSQGGALALYTGLQMEHALAGVVSMSGYLPKPAEWKAGVTAAALKTPCLLCHGDSDPMVKLQWAEEAEAALREAGLERVELKVYQGMQHSVSPAEMEDVRSFLVSVLGQEQVQAGEPVAGGSDGLRAAAAEAGMEDTAQLGEKASKLNQPGKPSKI